MSDATLLRLLNDDPDNNRRIVDMAGARDTETIIRAWIATPQIFTPHERRVVLLPLEDHRVWKSHGSDLPHFSDDDIALALAEPDLGYAARMIANSTRDISSMTQLSATAATAVLTGSNIASATSLPLLQAISAVKARGGWLRVQVHDLNPYARGAILADRTLDVALRRLVLSRAHVSYQIRYGHATVEEYIALCGYHAERDTVARTDEVGERWLARPELLPGECDDALSEWLAHGTIFGHELEPALVARAMHTPAQVRAVWSRHPTAPVAIQALRSAGCDGTLAVEMLDHLDEEQRASLEEEGSHSADWADLRPWVLEVPWACAQAWRWCSYHDCDDANAAIAALPVDIRRAVLELILPGWKHDARPKENKYTDLVELLPAEEIYEVAPAELTLAAPHSAKLRAMFALLRADVTDLIREGHQLSVAAVLADPSPTASWSQTIAALRSASL